MTYVRTCGYGAPAYGHLPAVGHVDAVRVGAPRRRRDGQPRHGHVPRVGDRHVHLHAVPHLQLLHHQPGAPPQVQRLTKLDRQLIRIPCRSTHIHTHTSGAGAGQGRYRRAGHAALVVRWWIHKQKLKKYAWHVNVKQHRTDD